MQTRVKICCIGSVDEAWTAIRAGAAALGLVSEMPSGPGVIAEELIADIAAVVPPGVATFLLTSRQDAGSIIEQQRRTRVNTIQICDHLVEGTYTELRRAMPGVKVVQVIHVTGEESVAEARRVAREIDAILLDSGNQSLPVKELGGTGRTHDWSLSRRIVEECGVPVFLAGGLRESNVGEAIRVVRPYGVDLCSSVRTDGQLDEEKLGRFFAAVTACSDL
jgi:phosphoribosylanthranilate isomerase